MRDLLERSLGARIAVRIDAPAGLPPAEVDANALELAILNIAINARDAMPDGGLIEISLRLERVNAKGQLRPGDYLRLDITDTGVGMDEATLNRAIEPFFSSKPIGKGTGLGLSMVHGLAEQLNGAFRLASQVGRGTVATLLLPASVSPRGEVNEPTSETVSARSAMVLLVDDDFLIAMSTAAMLEDLGHGVVEASSGQQALEILKSARQIDLMITDRHADSALPSPSCWQLATRTSQALRVRTSRASPSRSTWRSCRRRSANCSADQREVERRWAGAGRDADARPH
jgi:hypothetical protein